jgi:hypothetical protein
VQLSLNDLWANLFSHCPRLVCHDLNFAAKRNVADILEVLVAVQDRLLSTCAHTKHLVTGGKAKGTFSINRHQVTFAVPYYCTYFFVSLFLALNVFTRSSS